MKTAEEWANEEKTQQSVCDDPYCYCEVGMKMLLEAVQRDAWQQGMDDAIKTLDNTRQDLERLAVYGAGLVEGIIALKSAKKLGVKL